MLMDNPIKYIDCYIREPAMSSAAKNPPREADPLERGGPKLDWKEAAPG